MGCGVWEGQARYAESMAEENELVTVYRSADVEAESEARAVCEMLQQTGLTAEVADDSAPGVVVGSFEVRVPRSQAAVAERLIGVQPDLAEEAVDPSHDLDMVPVFASDAHNADMLAMEVNSILEANGIPTLVVAGSPIPSLPCEIRVPRSRLEEARAALAAAEEAGPAAAEQAELESESENPPAVSADSDQA